jgi:membrane carboxypeptidase/penicillin-binding protein PbpC
VTAAGSLSLTSALASSSNTAALRLAQRVGLDAVVQKARDLGISSPLAAQVPGLVLGQNEVTLLELSSRLCGDCQWGRLACRHRTMRQPAAMPKPARSLDRCPLPSTGRPLKAVTATQSGPACDAAGHANQ